MRSATSSGKSIVSGAARRAKRSDSGSTKVVFTTASRSTASTPPRKPTMIPSITNGQRMNQLVAPTSFMTSTSRRRARVDDLAEPVRVVGRHAEGRGQRVRPEQLGPLLERPRVLVLGALE